MTPQPGFVLVVNAHKDERARQARQLEQEGHHVAQAGDGWQALEVARAQPIDLILLDITAPEMDGCQVLAHLQDDPELRQAPVIVVAATSERERVIQCVERGAADYLFEPIDQTLLRVRIANAQLAAKAVAANRAQSEFVSLVAHELKVPMTSIKGYTDILLSGHVGPTNEAQVNFLRVIRANVDRMNKLVSNLSDLARIEANRLLLEFQALSLANMLDEVRQSLGQQIADKGQTMEVAVPDDLAPVWGDRSRLIQVIANLVSNAHMYTPQGGAIVVTAERTTDGGTDVVHIAVRDNGLGIHPNDQDKIFAKFFRAQDEEAQQETGTGLGLSITKHLVEAQGGRIWFESEYRQGTTFHFTIPVAEEEIAA
ncbi:MAG: HAMP domain-containing histidine kinase [Anaerolineae bacterium]|nr:HAMP domain-containing histidine kinase [Anaerolineae bacterium]